MESYLSQPTKIKISPAIFAAGFSRIFWGLIFVILDFTINSFDLLPDLIGYWLVASGSGRIVALSKTFESVKAIAITLAICWVIDLVLPRDLQFGFGVVITALTCIMIWQLMEGVAEFAMSRNRSDLASKAKTRRMVYVVVSAISVLIVLGGTSDRTNGPLAVLVFFAFFVVMVLILHQPEPIGNSRSSRI